MKTTYKSLLVLAILIMSIFVNNTGYAHKTTAGKALSPEDILSLAPVTPSVADFNEDDDPDTTADIIVLAPTTPAEADFSDSW
jgi:hypothetical protein